MERPKKISNKECRDYIVYLEKQLGEYSARPVLTKLYVGVKKQADHIAQLMNSDELTIDLSDKEDKAFDRIFKIFEKLKPLMDTLKEYEKEFSIEEEEQKAEGLVEQFIYGEESEAK